jgi:hypothetical protein
METRKRMEFWKAFLNAILQVWIAQAMRISPVEAASILEAPDAVEQRSVSEAHHGR